MEGLFLVNSTMKQGRGGSWLHALAPLYVFYSLKQ